MIQKNLVNINICTIIVLKEFHQYCLDTIESFFYFNLFVSTYLQ